jgi:hypothetical protein
MSIIRGSFNTHRHSNLIRYCKCYDKVFDETTSLNDIYKSVGKELV